MPAPAAAREQVRAGNSRFDGNITSLSRRERGNGTREAAGEKKSRGWRVSRSRIRATGVASAPKLVSNLLKRETSESSSPPPSLPPSRVPVSSVLFPRMIEYFCRGAQIRDGPINQCQSRHAFISSYTRARYEIRLRYLIVRDSLAMFLSQYESYIMNIEHLFESIKDNYEFRSPRRFEN